MTIKRVNPSDGVETNVYSSAVLCKGTNRTLYISGQVGVDENGRAENSIDIQCRQAWRNIESILSRSGMTCQDIVKTTVFLTSASYYPAFVRVRTDILDGNKPASTLIIVAGLLKPEWKVEIEAIAVR